MILSAFWTGGRPGRRSGEARPESLTVITIANAGNLKVWSLPHVQISIYTYNAVYIPFTSECSWILTLMAFLVEASVIKMKFTKKMTSWPLPNLIDSQGLRTWLLWMFNKGNLYIHCRNAIRSTRHGCAGHPESWLLVWGLDVHDLVDGVAVPGNISVPIAGKRRNQTRTWQVCQLAAIPPVLTESSGRPIRAKQKFSTTQPLRQGRKPHGSPRIFVEFHAGSSHVHFGNPSVSHWVGHPWYSKHHRMGLLFCMDRVSPLTDFLAAFTSVDCESSAIIWS